MDKTESESTVRFSSAARLTVKWSGPGWREIEDRLREVLAEFGLECWAQGYDYTTHERDMAFRPVEVLQLPARERVNKWTIVLDSLPMSVIQAGKRVEESTFIVSRIELNGEPLRCAKAALILSPKAPVALHLEIMPRGLEIITEDAEPTPPVEKSSHRLLKAICDNGEWIIDEDSAYILDEHDLHAVVLNVAKVTPIGEL